MMSNGWIGVDLDGTLAEYSGWKGPEYIGPPIQTMLDRVNEWIAGGVEVKIFTARATVPEQLPYVQAWLDEYGLGHLEITNVKDFRMIQLWDDRCIQVMSNTGVSLFDAYNEVIKENLDLNQKIEKLKEKIEELKIKIGDIRRGQ